MIDDCRLKNNQQSTINNRQSIEIIRFLEYDAITVGNEDYHFWKNFSKNQVKRLPFTLFAANLQSYIIFDVSGVKVGVVGCASPIAHAKQYAKELRRECDLIIALTHLGLEEDIRFAKDVKGVDIILGGHHHLVLNPPIQVGNCIICQHGGHGRYMGRLDIQINNDESYRKINSDLIDLIQIEPDTDVQQFLYAQEVAVNGKRMKLGTPIGESLETFTGENTDFQTPLGDIVADAIRDVAGADIVLMLTRSMRSYLRRGTIRVLDVYDIVYQNLDIIKWRFSGKLLWNLLEQSLVPDPRGQPRHFYIAGMELKYRLCEHSGIKLEKATVNQQRLRNDALYTVAADAFVSSGHFFPLFNHAKRICSTGIGTRDALILYIQKYRYIPL
jgi:2',3'-cyclic-nucleotide 2'-phosphodiesterase (5'-nucleotidase family)